MDKTTKSSTHTTTTTINTRKDRSERWPHTLQAIAVSNTQDKNEAHHQQQQQQQHSSISIISFNILAESYLTKRSHPNLPEEYSNVAFNPKKRRELLKQTLTKLAQAFRPVTACITDIICLQEVDLYDEVIKDHLNELNYDSMKTNRYGRADSCCIFWNRDKFQLLDYQLINFDDLATLSSSTTTETTNKNDETEHTNQKIKAPRPTELTGLVQSFLRKNTAISVILEHISSKEKVVISCSHLYWNPNYEYVKLAQCKYLLDQCHTFSQKHVEEGDNTIIPLVICGDFNSKPDSFVYRFIMDGVVDARRIAPWHYWPDDLNMENGENATNTEDKKSFENNQEQLLPSLNELSINDTNAPSKYAPFANLNREESSAPEYFTVPKVRYLVDFSLNKFSRWLRMLGIDTELETELEEKERTSGIRIALFERAYKEKRCLITTSYKLLLRKACPPGTYLINPSKNIKEAFCHLLLTHGITLEPSTFLTRCVVCNHNIEQVYDEKKRIEIFHKNGLFEVVPDLDVYQCNGCRQGYWWSDRPNSSASRVKNAVSYLFQLALEYGVPYKGNLDIFDFLDIEDITQHKEKTFTNMNKEALSEVLGWLRDGKLVHSLPSLTSAYYDPQTKQEQLSFTNVTDSFIGLLDYIFYEHKHWTCSHRLDVPMIFEEMNGDDLKNGHCIPSDLWPSDHLAIGCLLVKKE